MNDLKQYEQTLRQIVLSDSADIKMLLFENPLYYENQTDIKPWEHPCEYVPYLFDVWKMIKEKLLPDFDTRKSRGDKGLMLKGMVCLITSFYWIRGTHSETFDWDEVSNKDFAVSPINWKERAEYILQKPNQFPAFVQLDELFIEMEKQFYKWKAMTNR
ncbi:MULTISPECIES: YpoC family protein [Bacillus]|uniref:YpoC-like domain-containing protein n=2 Tax=Bacillus TaxID=1386 RepID=A0A0M4FQE4_9BACI|nr:MULTISPECIES: hypothetical protein [Bacillus]ALC81384.1 hypothetical protein AM592_07085 [Bacillus gobiensis]MBP1080412.1 hypothetical protein [Bacillus capparidis]MED1094269.1 hypothetical protein [Bacillus capparidis]